MISNPLIETGEMNYDAGNVERIPPCKRMRRLEDGTLEVIEVITERPREPEKTYSMVDIHEPGQRPLSYKMPGSGRPGRPRKDQAPPAVLDVEEIIALCNQRVTIPTISQRYHVAQMTVWKLIDTYRKAHPGYQIPNAITTNPITAEIIMELRAKGMTASQIAERYGCTRYTIYARMRTYQENIRQGGGSNDRRGEGCGFSR